MENVKIMVVEGKLTIEADARAPGSKTKNGNTMVATTGNWVKVPELGEGWSCNFVLVRKERN